MNWFNSLFGEGENLTALQMAVRAFFTFFITLLLVRVGGVRMFGKKSALDIIVFIMLGAILSRSIVGASDFLPTICAGAVMVILHRLIAFLCVRNAKLQYWIAGDKVVLYKDNELVWHNLRKTSISKSDIMKSLRLETQQTSFENIETIYLENNGRISFIIKNKKPDEIENAS